MESDEVRARLDAVLRELVNRDIHLLENNLSERCIASTLAMYPQPAFADYAVDVEYNRAGCSQDARPARRMRKLSG